jgi:hypothetical protein
MRAGRGSTRGVSAELPIPLAEEPLAPKAVAATFRTQRAVGSGSVMGVGGSCMAAGTHVVVHADKVPPDALEPRPSVPNVSQPAARRSSAAGAVMGLSMARVMP